MMPDTTSTATGGTVASGGVMDGLAGMANVFIDPATTAAKVPSKFSWLWPVVVLSAGYVVFGYLMLPYTLQLAEASLTKRNIPPESLERARSITETMTKIMTPLTPVFVIGFLALFAVLIKLVYSVMDVKPKFRDVFSLLASCSIIGLFQYVAAYFVIRMKGDPLESPDQMSPPFGFDIFFPELHGPLHAVLNFFSIFEIWYLVVLVFGLAFLTHSSKTKAILAVTPAWLLPLLMRVVGSFFQGKS